MNHWVRFGIGALVVGLIIGTIVFVVTREQEEVIPEVLLEEEVVRTPTRTTIGTSIEGRAIEVYTFPAVDSATTDPHILFVGGVHGGYEWNSTFLAYRAIDYFTENPKTIPDHITVTIIPTLNPDGLYAVVGTEGRFTVDDTPDIVDASGTGRFNANNVDLNRNFDCKWQEESTWRGDAVSAGTAPFSEPEAAVLRDFVLAEQPDAVVFWHSKAGAVYGSECEEGILPETLDVMNVYAEAGGYAAVPIFDAYPITGDAEGWLASIGIPAVTVELTTHENIEWDKNKAGMEALFNYYK